jgi:dTDP-4-amino-4,6-dideoxygalactose transaminase
MKEKQLFVTRPSLPPLEEFIPYLETIWQTGILTNGGPFHQQLERGLCSYLGLKHLALTTNGTTGLIIALQALEISGEVITTPFSFVATSNALIWHGNTPVFVDIEPDTCNIDAGKIEQAITENTSAILAVHCYGNPCNALAIDQIAKKYNLKVIYDACHAFGVSDNYGSILRRGDLSVLSFHATKIFHTFEGGAIISENEQLYRKICDLKNFGFQNEVTVVAPGMNGKMSELNAAFGLVQINHIDKVLQQRRHVAHQYQDELSDLPGIKLLFSDRDKLTNASYFPILVEDAYPLSRNELYNALKSEGINGRRYFYPLISQIEYFSGLPSAAPNNLPVASKIAEQVICLPIYPMMTDEDINRVTNSIRRHARRT